MHSKAKNYALIFCLFVFLFVIIGGGLHLNPGGIFRMHCETWQTDICTSKYEAVNGYRQHSKSTSQPRNRGSKDSH